MATSNSASIYTTLTDVTHPEWGAGAGLLAHIVVSKYDDHLPLYRQAEIFARDKVGLETSTLSGWVGATAAASSYFETTI